MDEFELYGLKWKDATSYSRNDKERKPTAYETVIGDVRVYITCGHIHYRPEWVFSCHALGFDTKHLPKAKSKEDAAEQAMKYCREKVLFLHSMFFPS